MLYIIGLAYGVNGKSYFTKKEQRAKLFLKIITVIIKDGGKIYAKCIPG